MGRVRPNKTGRKDRSVKRAVKTKAKSRDLDQVHEDLTPENKLKLLNQEIDPDLPGLGQFYCIECARHFQNETSLSNHVKTKIHKKRYVFLFQTWGEIRRN